MISNESCCNFCFFFYCIPTPYIFRKVPDFDILAKNVLIQSESIGFGQSYPTLI